ncbi:MAG: MFS transporter, partial [Stackebrandtia sp.]
MLPLTVGFLVSGPAAGRLSDRYGGRMFATGGMLLAAVTFVLMIVIPVDFDYRLFALIIFANGLGMGIFTSPNTAAVMSSVPAAQRGVASGMRATLMNGGMALAIGTFFSLMIIGLSGTLPSAMDSGLREQGVSADVAGQLADMPPVGSLFATFLGYNPFRELLGPTGALDEPGVHGEVLTGQHFFPQLISGPFHSGLIVVFLTAAVMMLLGAIASWFTRGDYAGYATEPDESAGPAGSMAARSVRSGHVRGAQSPVSAGPDRSVCGRVLRTDGTPPADVVLTLIDQQGHQVSRATTDAGGAYTVAAPTWGSHVLIVSARGQQPAAVTVEVVDHPQHLDITLRGAGELSGFVRKTGGYGLSGATVTVTDSRGEVVGATVTNSDGSYLCSGITPGSYTLITAATRMRPHASTLTVPD